VWGEGDCNIGEGGGGGERVGVLAGGGTTHWIMGRLVVNKVNIVEFIKKEERGDGTG